MKKIKRIYQAKFRPMAQTATVKEFKEWIDRVNKDNDVIIEYLEEWKYSDWSQYEIVRIIVKDKQE